MARQALAIGLLSFGLVFGVTSSAAAQTANPRIELGVVASGLPSWHVLGLGVRFTATSDDNRFAFEAELDWNDLLRERRYVDQVMWFYSWQVRQTLMSDARSSVFVTYGTAGWGERSSECCDPYRFKTYWIPPFLPLAGIGGQRVLAKYAALRGDAQLLFGPFEGSVVVPRISGGVSVPIGGYRR